MEGFPGCRATDINHGQNDDEFQCVVTIVSYLRWMGEQLGGRIASHANVKRRVTQLPARQRHWKGRRPLPVSYWSCVPTKIPSSLFTPPASTLYSPQIIAFPPR